MPILTHANHSNHHSFPYSYTHSSHHTHSNALFYTHYTLTHIIQHTHYSTHTKALHYHHFTHFSKVYARYLPKINYNTSTTKQQGATQCQHNQSKRASSAKPHALGSSKITATSYYTLMTKEHLTEQTTA